MAAQGKPTPPQVEALIEYLKTTGTGQAKLDIVHELGCSCSCLKEFLALASARLPKMTMGKIGAYLELTGVPLPVIQETPAEEPVKKEEVVEEKAEDKAEEVSKPNVAEMTAAESIELIKTLSDKALLEDIFVNDKRKTVMEAAQKRLNELGA